MCTARNQDRSRNTQSSIPVDAKTLPAPELQRVGRNKLPIGLSVRDLPILPGIASRNEITNKAGPENSLSLFALENIKIFSKLVYH